MRNIHKFTLDYLHQNIKFNLPIDATAIKAGHEDGVIVIWIELSPHLPHSDRYFYVSGTGFDIPVSATYIDTVQMHKGVDWHVYEGHEGLAWHVYEGHEDA